jgi:hypothetical protein
MEYGPSLETDSRSAGQEITRLWACLTPNSVPVTFSG